MNFYLSFHRRGVTSQARVWLKTNTDNSMNKYIGNWRRRQREMLKKFKKKLLMASEVGVQTGDC